MASFVVLTPTLKHVFIYFKMDKVINLGILHVGELIFENFDTPGLIKCLEVSQTWKILAENVLLKRWKGKIFQACNRGYIEIVKLLLKHSDKIDLNARNNRGQTAFIGACAYGKVHVVQFLLSHPNIEVNTHDDKGWTALVWAYTNNHKDVVKLLIDHSDRKLDLNVRNSSGWTALMVACEDGRKDVVKLILEHRNPNIDLNARNNQGSTVLMLACINGHKDIVVARFARYLKAMNGT